MSSPSLPDDILHEIFKMCSIDDIKVLCFMDRRFYTIAIPFLYQYIKCRDLSDHGSILLLKTLARSPRLSNLVQTFQFSSMFRDTLMSVIKLLRTCLRQMHSLVALDLEIPASCRSLFVDTTFRLAEARLSIKYDAYTIQWLETQHALTFLFVSPYSHATQRFTLSPNALPRLSRLYAPARVIADFASGRPLYEAAIRDRFVTPDVPLLEETMRALALSPHPSQVMSLLIFFRVIDVSTLFLAMSRHLSKLEKFVVFTSQFSQTQMDEITQYLPHFSNLSELSFLPTVFRWSASIFPELLYRWHQQCPTLRRVRSPSFDIFQQNSEKSGQWMKQDRISGQWIAV